MKVTIQLWQSQFNDEWNCDISTNENGYDETDSWAVEDFCSLLKLLSKKFPNAKCITEEK